MVDEIFITLNGRSESVGLHVSPREVLEGLSVLQTERIVLENLTGFKKVLN